MTEDEMVGCYHQLNRHDFEQSLGYSEGQGSLARCSPWGHKESDTTERLNNNKARRPEGCKFERGTESPEMGWCLLGVGVQHEQRPCGMVFICMGETSV